MKSIFKASFIALSCVGLLGACGSAGTTTSSGSTSVSNLSDLPDTSTIVSTESGSSNISSLVSASLSGTAPIFSDLTVEPYFFADDFLTAVGNHSITLTENVRNDFWKGETKCRIISSNAQNFIDLQRSGTALCYMKNMPTAASGVTFVSGDVTDASTLFTQQADDRIVKVVASAGEMGSQNVFLKVYGTNNAPGQYKVDLSFCSSDNEATGTQTISVDDATDIMTMSESNNEEGGSILSVHAVTAKITRNSNGRNIFDNDADKTLNMQFYQTAEGRQITSKAEVTISNNLITNKFSQTVASSQANETFKNYSQSTFTGTSFADLRFYTAANHMLWSTDYQNNDFSHEFSAGMEYNDTGSIYYADTTDLEIYTTVAGTDFDIDSFFGTAPAIPTVDVSGVNCETEPDVEVTMDLSNSVVAAIASDCEGSLANDETNILCEGSEVSAARYSIMAAEIQNQ